MVKRKKKTKVVKMQKRMHLGTGLFILFFAAYILVLFAISLTREHVSIAEVMEKQLADDNIVRGIILRNEEIVTAPQDGYINYLVGSGARVGTISDIYSLDSEGTVSESLNNVTTTPAKLTANSTQSVRNQIAAYLDSADLSNYQDITNLKYNLESTLLEINNEVMSKSIKNVLSNHKKIPGFQVYRAKKSGIACFSMDGLEDTTIDSLSENLINSRRENITQLRENKQVKQGSPVYRLVTSDNWKLIIPLSEHLYNYLSDKSSVSITIKKDGIQATPSITTFMIGKKYYARLDFHKYMVRYINDRYLNIEIELDHSKGLKIPKKSIISKKFYAVPRKYIVTEKKSGDTGIYEKTFDSNSNPVATFQKVSIYSKTNNTKVVYIDFNRFEPGTSLVPSKSKMNDVFLLTNTVKLEGVYNCNKGYCEFRQIEKVYENKEYAVVAKDTLHGLSEYDHIILNPTLIDENDIIY